VVKDSQDTDSALGAGEEPWLAEARCGGALFIGVTVAPIRGNRE
jgi:hypothetical protein